MTEEAGRANDTAPVDRLSEIWRRIREHKVAQWTVAYVALAYALQHGTILISESLEWPTVVARLSLIVLVLGLPLVMTLAWYHGARASRHFSHAELSILAALLVMTSLLFYVFVRPSNDVAPSKIATAATVSQPANGVSLAVLPFLDLSPAKDQEFFSDGMTEEITSALVKVPSLRVVGRTSAFQFKGANKDLRAIGQALSATHLIEGSVRKDGNQVRITAQLVKADDGTHLWTESYDRELKGIFAVQEDIAQAIAASLQVPLGLKKGEALVSNRIGDTASYQDYLRARALFRLRGSKSLTDAITLLEQVVARDPGYAPAWALLSLSYSLIPQYDLAWFSGDAAELRRVTDASLPRAEAAARRAIALDGTLADGYEALGLVRERRTRLLEAEDLYRKALTLDPNHPDTLHQYSQVLAEVGRFDEAMAMRQRLQSIEPLVPVFNVVTAVFLWLNGQNQDAIAISRSFPPDFVVGSELASMIYASVGRYRDAADAILQIPDESFSPGTRDMAVRLLRTAPAAAPGVNKLPRLGSLAFVFLQVGAPTRALENLEDNLDAGYATPSWSLVLWHSSYAQVRKTERFRSVVRRAGLIDYWRAKGWPPQCHPTTADDFECS